MPVLVAAIVLLYCGTLVEAGMPKSNNLCSFLGGGIFVVWKKTKLLNLRKASTHTRQTHKTVWIIWGTVKHVLC